MIEDTQRKGIPVFVTEWGINEEQGGEAALTQGKAFAEYLNEKKSALQHGSLCNKEETFFCTFARIVEHTETGRKKISQKLAGFCLKP